MTRVASQTRSSILKSGRCISRRKRSEICSRSCGRYRGKSLKASNPGSESDHEQGILPLISMTRGMSHFLLPLLLITAAQAQTNRFDTAEGVEEGRALFQIHCTYCHGARGEGGHGADLTTGAYRQGGSDADLFTTIREGIP